MQYGLGNIPIGGFVQLPQMAPMGAIEGKSENSEPLPPIKPLDKIIVAFAGPLFSLLLAFVFACGVWKFGQLMPDEPVIGYTGIGMPAEKSGLQAGDRILAVDGEEVNRFGGLTHSVMWTIASGAGDNVEFKVQRPGETEPRIVNVRAPYKESDEYKKWETGRTWWEKLYMRPPLRKVGIAPAAEARIKLIMPNSPAATAGLQPGDVILKINGEKAWTPYYVQELAQKKPDSPIALTVQRGDKTLELSLKPRFPEEDPRKGDDKVALAGIAQFEPLNPNEQILIYPSPFTLVADCFRNTAATVRKLLTPNSPIGVSQMSGPVGILNLYYNLFKSEQWWRLIMFFSVVLNVGLAVFNMLPLPVLDGGHITMATIEAVRKREPNYKLMEIIQTVCVLCLLSFVLFVTMKDVGHITQGDSAEPKFKAPAAAPATP